MDSADNIDRLVEIEHQAADIIADAEKKASQSLLETKSAVESMRNQKLVEERKKLEAEHVSFLKSLEAQSAKEISDYRATLNSIPLNTEALKTAIQNIIRAGE